MNYLFESYRQPHRSARPRRRVCSNPAEPLWSHHWKTQQRSKVTEEIKTVKVTELDQSATTTLF